MSKRLGELLEFLDRTRSELQRSFAAATREQLTRKPDAGGWSVAEILDHLGIVESGVARLTAKGIARGKAEGLPQDISDQTLLGTFDAFSHPKTRGAFEAPSFTAPGPNPDPDEVRENLRRSREAYRGALQSADGMDLSRLDYNHIILGTLNFYEWAMFIGQHESRHTSQITRTLNELT